MKNLDNLLKTRFLLASAFTIVGEDPPVDTNTEVTETPEEKAAKEAAGKNGTKPKVTFTEDQQKYVNSLLAEEKRKGREASDKLVLQLETQKNQAGTTAAEKARLETQIEDLRNSHLTEKELADKERTKQDKKKDEQIKAAETKAKEWEDRFKMTTIKRQITDASVLPGHKALNPAHIVAFLLPDTRLVEELDEENKPTGEWIAKTKVRVKDKEGKPATLDMAVTEAVKYLSEQEEHAGLFDSGVSGGMGGNPNRNRKGSAGDPNQPPEDPAAYQEWRRKNPGAVGAPRRTVRQ